MNKEIATLSLSDISSISKGQKYFDGEIFFADNITTIPNMARVFRVNFLVLAFCIQGEAHLHIDDKAVTMKRHDALFANSNSLISIDWMSNDVSYKIVALNSKMAFSLINKSFVDAFMTLIEKPVISLTQDEIQLVIRYYELADFKMTNHDFIANKDAILSLLRAFSIDMLSCINRHHSHDSNILRQGDKLYRRFLYLITSNVDGHRSVRSYADELCVTPKYLTSVCRQHGNKTASELITNALVTRIKQMLLYSDKSVKEIATELNFENLSFFGKFVKKHFGQSPINYRKHNHYGQ